MDHYIPYLRLEIETLDQAARLALAALIIGVINPKFPVHIVRGKEGQDVTANFMRAAGLATGKCAPDPKVLLPIVFELLEIQEEEI